MLTDEVCQQTGGIESLCSFTRAGFGLLLRNPSLCFLLNLTQLFFSLCLKASQKIKYNYELQLYNYPWGGGKKARQYTSKPQNHDLCDHYFTVIFVAVFLRCSWRKCFLCLGRKK